MFGITKSLKEKFYTLILWDPLPKVLLSVLFIYQLLRFLLHYEFILTLYDPSFGEYSVAFFAFSVCLLIVGLYALFCNHGHIALVSLFTFLLIQTLNLIHLLEDPGYMIHLIKNISIAGVLLLVIYEGLVKKSTPVNNNLFLILSRTLLITIFIWSIISKILDFASKVEILRSFNIPFCWICLILIIVFEVICVFSVLALEKSEYFIIAILVYLVVIQAMMHTDLFYQPNRFHLLKDLAIATGFIVLLRLQKSATDLVKSN